jgi:hypothetical protein
MLERSVSGLFTMVFAQAYGSRETLNPQISVSQRGRAGVFGGYRFFMRPKP